MFLFVAPLLLKPVRNTYKRLHPVSVQVRLYKMLPGNTEMFIPQYHIMNNFQTMLFLK